eukprot:9801215-Lingulodinium_polyedra.AAC.1
MTPGGGNLCTKFLFCKQNPRQFHGLIIERCEPRHVAVSQLLAGYGRLGDIPFERTWQIRATTLATWIVGRDIAIPNVLVVRNTSFLSPHWIVSNDDPIPLQAIIDNADYPMAKKVNDRLDRETVLKKRRHDRDFKEEEAKAGGVGDGASDEAESHSGGEPKVSDEGSAEEGDEEVEEAEDLAMEAAFGRLERQRPEREALVIVRLPDFQAMPRANGDSWQGQVR